MARIDNPQSERWTVAHRQLLDESARDVQRSTVGTSEERREVAEALRKAMHRLSLRQGILRLLDTLGLQHLKPRWDELYGKRSTLVHGLAPTPGVNYDPLAGAVVSLCGYIVLKAVAREVPGVDAQVAQKYQV